MSGQELKQKLISSGVKLADLAARMNTSPQNLSLKFSAQDVKTGFLEELCDLLDKDMSFFYDGTKYQPQKYAPKYLYEELQEEINKIHERVKNLECKIAEKQ